MTPSRGAKVQLGSGGNLLDGWLNTDVDGSAPYHLDATRPWRVRDLSFVYADNVFEHFTLADARQVLRHARGAMRPGGTIRLCVPDARGPSEVYVEGGDELAAMMDRHRRNGYEAAHPQEVLRVIFVLNDHAAGYQWDEASLTDELKAAGFSHIRRCALGVSDLPELRGLESRTEPIDERLLIVLEASR